MTVSEKKFNKIGEIFLILIAVLQTFRKPCTYVIIVFALFCIFFYKKMSFSKRSLQLSILIVLPLIIEILFFWNNDSLLLGIKALEKSIALLLFPIFIIGNYKMVDFYKIARYYSVITTIIVLGYYIAYINFDTNYITIYSQGDGYLWAIGYAFANYVGMQGPALNMHMAFVTISNFYFIFYFFKKSHYQIIINSLLFLISFYFVVFINSKLALANVIIGIILIFFFELRKMFTIQKVIGLFVIVFLFLSTITYFYVQKNPYMITKYKEKTFAYFDKIGKLDEVKDPDSTVYHSLATRLSIWKATLELASNHPFVGVGASDSKPELVKYFKRTNQNFLAKYEFPVHNQFLDSLLKFGILGLISTLLYLLQIGYLGIKSKQTLIFFFFILFFTSNLTDDFLIRFDGIVYSSFWSCIFISFLLNQQKNEVFEVNAI